MTIVRIEPDVNADLKLLKVIKKCKNVSATIRFIMHHAGYTEAFFDKMRSLGVGEQ